MTPKIVLFGATGYTGHLVAEELVARGLRPVLCGRNAVKLERLSKQLGGLGTAICDVNEKTGLAALLSKGDILISSVGPFAKYGRTAISAAIKKGAIYLDSTGEPAFIQEVFESFGPRAQAAETTLIPACGYDYIPGNCAAGIALSDSGTKATRLDIGYYSKHNGRVEALDMSQGTAASLLLAMVAPVKMWRTGKWVAQTGGTRVRCFLIDGRAQPALTISSSEHFSLPRLYPALRDINTYLGWFGKQTYIMKYAAIIQSCLLKLPGYGSMAAFLLSLLPESKGKGPDAAQRRENESHIVAEAYDADGAALGRSELVGVDGYTFTAKFIAWAADMASQGHVLKSGAVGPIEAFGLDALRQGCVQSGLQIVESKSSLQ